jgi:hypothetical protein
MAPKSHTKCNCCWWWYLHFSFVHSAKTALIILTELLILILILLINLFIWIGLSCFRPPQLWYVLLDTPPF